MVRTERNTIRFVSFALVLMLLPMAGAQSTDDLTASSVEFGNSTVAGTLQMFWLRDMLGNSASELEMTVSGKMAVGEQREATANTAVIRGSSIEILDPVRNDQRIMADDFTWGLLGSDDTYAIQIIAHEGMKASISTQGGSAKALTNPRVCDDEIQRYGIANSGKNCGTSPTGGAYFEHDPVDGEYIVASTAGGLVDVTFTGDMQLQFNKLAIGTDEFMASGRTTEELAGPGDAYRSTTTRHVILDLQDATITIRSNLAGVMDWASSGISLDAVGAINLADCIGFYNGKAVDHTDLGFEDERLVLMPAGHRLSVDMPSDSSNSFSPAALFSAPESVSGWMAKSSAVVVLLAALAFGTAWVIRAAHVPSLSSIESAIVAGDFRQAAKMAGRLQRKRPQAGGAVVARAVALSKSGRHQEVVDEMETIANRGDNSDGVLNFVVGLAMIEIGRRTDGRFQLREAARRTPSLEPDVAKKLGVTHFGGSHAYA